jgi:hypothetical protein
MSKRLFEGFEVVFHYEWAAPGWIVILPDGSEHEVMGWAEYRELNAQDEPIGEVIHEPYWAVDPDELDTPVPVSSKIKMSFLKDPDGNLYKCVVGIPGGFPYELRRDGLPQLRPDPV